MYDDCKITEEGGIKHATSIHGVVSVLPDGETKIFMRNAIKMPVGGGAQSRHRMVVAELDGVRAYVMGNKVILTKQDLYF